MFMYHKVLSTIYIYTYAYLLAYDLHGQSASVPIILLVKYPHRKSSLRGSVAQRVDEDIQGGESPYHPYHLVGLSNLMIYRNIYSIDKWSKQNAKWLIYRCAQIICK